MVHLRAPTEKRCIDTLVDELIAQGLAAAKLQPTCAASPTGCWSLFKPSVAPWISAKNAQSPARRNLANT